MKPLKILFQAHHTLFQGTGGDQVQFLKTKECLEKLGHRVDYSLELEPRLETYDLVHLFNLHHPQDLFLQAANARAQKKPVVLSTIYWSLKDLNLANPYFNPSYREPLSRRFKRFRRQIAFMLHLYNRAEALIKIRSNKENQLGYYGQAREILRLTDMLLPNAMLEYEQLKNDFPEIKGIPYRVVVNGIESLRCNSTQSNSFGERFTVRNYVLCVGRLEKRKNQVSLLKALHTLDRPVVLVGGSPDAAYAAEVRQCLRPMDVYVESWPHEKMNEVYAYAAVHALPSFYDTPGLASLEAASCGIPIVTGNRGSESEYFGPLADYCNPEDAAAIRNAVERGLNRPRPHAELRQHVVETYTWEQTARQTEAAYEAVLKNRGISAKSAI